MKEFFKQIQLLKKITALLICLGLLWNFQSSFSEKSDFAKNFAKNFSDENSDSEEKENFESQDLVFNFDHKNYAILKISALKNGFGNQLPISGFTLSIATPPPDFFS